MAGNETAGELYKVKEVGFDELAAAVFAYTGNPALAAFPFGAAYTLDLVAAVSGSPAALVMLADPEIKPQSKRAALWTVIMPARPSKG